MGIGVMEKVAILADAAKYDVSCSSSGSKRKNLNGGVGTTGKGICHAYTEDGRCVSLLKILLTNFCIYDCAYCVSRKSNDIRRAAFTVQEVVDLTMNFYRRNYIEGLFLSSGIFSSADYTMERLVQVAKKLRTEHRFNGYIHLKTIPGASDELMKEAGLYADRLSVNLEMPTRESLALMAPDKKREDMINPMRYLKTAIAENREDKKVLKKTPLFAPAGQTTQLVIGATPETDYQILWMADKFYRHMQLKRVYYSGYVPISTDNRLPAIGTPVPVIRENRLYQADWLLRFYKFQPAELLSDSAPLLDLEIDPKLSWALQHLGLFPIDIHTADYAVLIRVPGIGLESARKIIAARSFGRLDLEQIRKMGVVISRARYFITCRHHTERKDWQTQQLRQRLIDGMTSRFRNNFTTQLNLF